MGTFRELLRLLDPPERAALARFVPLCLMAPAADLAGVSMMIPLLQQAFDQGSSGPLAARMALVALALLAVGAFELLRGRAATALVTDVAHSWSVKLYELYGMEELEDHNRRTAMEAVSGARNDPAVCAGMIPACLGLAVDGLTTAAYALAMIYAARGVGAASCVLLAALMAGLYCRGRIYAARYGEKRRRLEIRASGMVSTMFGSYKEIRIDARRGNLLEKYRRASGECAQIQKDYDFTRGLQGVVLRDVMQSALFVLLAALLAAGLELGSILPQALIFITLLTRMLPVSKRIVEALTGLRFASRYFEALRGSLLRYGALRRAQADRTPLREKPVTLETGIRVEGLCFRYPNGKQIFENASIHIPAGRSTAVIGPSGGGKTTLLDLLLIWGRAGTARGPAGGTWGRWSATSPRPSSSTMRPSGATWPSWRRRRTRSGSSGAWSAPRSGRTCGRCRRAWTPSSGRTARPSPGDSASGSPWPGRCTRSPRSSSWTRPPPPWTWTPSGRSLTLSGRCGDRRPC